MTIRYHEPGHARYLTFGCYKRKYLFRHPELCMLFIQHLDEWRMKHGIKVYAFVIMANHVHLLVFGGDTDIGPAIRSLKQRFGWHALQWLQANRPETYNDLATKDHGKEVHRFWQAGGGYDRNVFSEDTVIRGFEYIHNNPVRAGLVQLPEDYVWSSARFWLKDDPAPLAMDVPEWWRERRE